MDGSDNPSTRPGGDEDGAADAVEMFTKVYEERKKRSGPVLQHLGTINVSRDLDVMRQVLGDKRLNFLGFSYETRLGAVYTAQFPKNVGRIVLDGAETLTESLTEQALVGAQDQQTALENFVTWCASKAGYPLGGNSRDAKQKITKLATALNTKPMVAGDGQEFTGDDLVHSLGNALYSKGNWPDLPQALTWLLADDNPRSLMQITDSLLLRPDPDDAGSDEGFGAGSDGGHAPLRATQTEGPSHHRMTTPAWR